MKIKLFFYYHSQANLKSKLDTQIYKAYNGENGHVKSRLNSSSVIRPN